MLQNIQEFYGSRLAATDGEIGHVKDFYFDDKSWAIRYAVVNTGTWLTGRHVLIAARALGKWDHDQRLLGVDLVKGQIEHSPSLEVHAPVSRPYEMEYYRYYGWPPYWHDNPVKDEATVKDEAIDSQHPHAGQHLQSSQGMTGYHLQGADGMIGRVSGLLVDDLNWTIQELVVAAGHGHQAKALLIPSAKIESIGFAEAKIFVNLSKVEIQREAETTGASSEA